jgi:hypothetical protein
MTLNLLKDMVKEKKGTNKEVKLGNSIIGITTQRLLGFSNVLISVDESGKFGLNSIEIDRLFNK